MLRHKGTIEIRTERLVLRRFTTDDAEDMFNNWANDDQVTKYLTWAPHGEIGNTRKLLTSWVDRYQNCETYHWAIVPRNYGKVIGPIGVINFSGRRESGEVGYCVSRSYWNQGIMTESLKAVIKYLIFEVGFHRISATHKVENPASGKVMLKSGMRYEGKLRKYSLNQEGKYVDSDLYAILEEDIKAG